MTGLVDPGSRPDARGLRLSVPASACARVRAATQRQACISSPPVADGSMHACVRVALTAGQVMCAEAGPRGGMAQGEAWPRGRHGPGGGMAQGEAWPRGRHGPGGGMVGLL